MKGIVVKRGFADTVDGQIHYAMAGKGDPVLFLHQTPRSWDEYRDVLPIIGKHYRAILDGRRHRANLAGAGPEQ